MPNWVSAASQEYLKRFPKDFSVSVKDIAAATRGKQHTPLIFMKKEAESIRAALPKQAIIICLDVLGKSVSTEQFAQELNTRALQGRPIALIIGGPDGIHPEFLAQADLRISLSKMTLPHPMVRVMLIEQLYRSWSILAGHPYHRA